MTNETPIEFTSRSLGKVIPIGKDESESWINTQKYWTSMVTNEKSAQLEPGKFKYADIESLDGYERMIITFLRMDHVKEFDLDIRKRISTKPNIAYELESYFFNPEYSSKNKPKKKPKLELVKPNK
jgi:hypothetical protein